MDSRATQQCNMSPMFMQFTGCHQPVQGFYWPENAIDRLMRNARAHKIQWSGATIHSFTAVLWSFV